MPDNLNYLLDKIADEALASGDQNILDLVERAANLSDGGKTPHSEATEPNLVERMEEVCAALDEATNYVGMDSDDAEDAIRQSIDNAYGIAGEVLTMLDGR